MWTCAKCGEQLEDTFGECWKCGTFKDGAENPEFKEQVEPGSPAAERTARPPIECVRCDQPLTHMGTKAFHEGKRWGALGDIGELFVNKETFDVYCCPRCGRVEFFVEGIGEGLRPT